MVRRSKWLGSALFIAILSSSGCREPKALTIEGKLEDPFVIDWAETSAMGLYVTAPDAEIPDRPREKVKGTAYWVIEATGFPSGFDHPVTYGVVPKDAKDATAEHGGPEGGAKLECGVEYKVAVVSLGGSAETLVSWDCK